MGKRSEMSVGKHAEVMLHLLRRQATGKRLVCRVGVSERPCTRDEKRLSGPDKVRSTTRRASKDCKLS